MSRDPKIPIDAEEIQTLLKVKIRDQKPNIVTGTNLYQVLKKFVEYIESRIGVGPKGDKGDIGEKGEKGEDGAPGPKGDKGEDGRIGVDGKALETHISINNEIEVVINWQIDIDPQGDGIQTYSQRHMEASLSVYGLVESETNKYKNYQPNYYITRSSEGDITQVIINDIFKGLIVII